jgi:hypothetical protein
VPKWWEPKDREGYVNGPNPNKPLTDEQIEQFVNLIGDAGSKTGNQRLLARLQLNSFVHRHGADACKAAFDSLYKRKT